MEVIETYLDRVNPNVAGWAASWVLASAVLMFWPSAATRGSRKGPWQSHDNAAEAQPAVGAAEGGAS
jgi:hypothetical protein